MYYLTLITFVDAIYLPKIHVLKRYRKERQDLCVMTIIALNAELLRKSGYKTLHVRRLNSMALEVLKCIIDLNPNFLGLNSRFKIFFIGLRKEFVLAKTRHKNCAKGNNVHEEKENSK